VRSYTFALSLLIALAIPVASANALIIDAFDDAAATAANSGTLSDTVITASGSFLGTNRELTSDWDSGPNSVDGEVDAGGSSLLNYSLGADTQGSTTIIWNDIGGVDLTEGGTQNAIGLSIVFDDLPADITLILTDSSLSSATATVTTSGGIFAPEEEFLLFSGFTGSVDPTDIETIELRIDSVFPATDMQIDFIESTFIPEPGTGTLLGISLVGLGLKRRKSRS